MRHRCIVCGKLTYRYQRINGGPWHCYDGCYETTGHDCRTIDGTPLWEGGKPLGTIEFGVLISEETKRKIKESDPRIGNRRYL